MGVALAVLALVASGCFYTPAAQRHIAASGGTDVPWWCEGSPDLSPADCETFSLLLDQALVHGYRYTSVADITATGATQLASQPADVGVAYGAVSATFDPIQPNVLLYEGNSPTSRLVGIAWAISGSEPDGFDGTRDVWTELPGGGVWWLNMWAVPGYENQPDVFASSHPCLESGVTLTATTDQCFLDSHPEALAVLVTNDDGIGAEGIDELVEALDTVPGVTIDVVAPATQQSGSGGSTTPGGVTGSPATTASGHPAIAVDGFPADSVIYAIETLGLDPDLVISGINEGQNLSLFVNLSGTVGAARRAARYGLDAIATSQGIGPGLLPDFPTGAALTLELLEDHRLGLVGAPYQTVTNLNVPSCVAPYTVRGVVYTTVGTSTADYGLQDCSSTQTAVADDLEAFNHGYASVTDVMFG